MLGPEASPLAQRGSEVQTLPSPRQPDSWQSPAQDSTPRRKLAWRNRCTGGELSADGIPSTSPGSTEPVNLSPGLLHGEAGVQVV